MNRKYMCNEDYFKDTESLEVCYWAGFISADGYIKIRPGGKRSLVFHLASVDKGHLEKFLECIQGNQRIYEYSDSVELAINSDTMCADLEKNFNIITKKSQVIKPPKISGLNKDAFILGYVDGNGWIYKTPTFLGFGVCTGSIDMATFLSENIPLALPRKRDERYFQMDLRFLGKDPYILHMLELPVPKLGRKWNKAQEFVNAI